MTEAEEDAEIIIESEPQTDHPDYIVWKITGRNQERVDDEATKIMRTVGFDGYACFSFPHRVKTGPYKGWFYSTGITRMEK